MLHIIETLLVLQDRDQKLMALREEAQVLPAEQVTLESKTTAALALLDQAKLKVKQLETERKKLELEVEAKKLQIEKYSIQQFQTKKNEEYRALGNEIDGCKTAIGKLDDQQLEFMEKIEVAQRHAAAVNEEAQATKRTMEERVVELKKRVGKLLQELTVAETERNQRAEGVDEVARAKYERLLKGKTGRVVVGITHGVCGGCHMGLSRSVVLQCQGGRELMQCPNCARILYYTKDMDLQVAD